MPAPRGFLGFGVHMGQGGEWDPSAAAASEGQLGWGGGRGHPLPPLHTFCGKEGRRGARAHRLGDESVHSCELTGADRVGG